MKILNIAKDKLTEEINSIHPKLIETYFKSQTYINVQYNTPEFFINRGLKFIYLYPILDLRFFNSGLIPSPPESVLNNVRQNRCKLVFFYPQEGNLFTNEQLEVLYEFLTENKLNKENTFIFNSNLILEDTVARYHKNLKDLITVKSMVFFEDNPWFIVPFYRSNEAILTKSKKECINNFQINITSNKKYYFNNLNRLPRTHRVLLFTLMYNNHQVRNKSLMSLGPISLYTDAKYDETFRYENMFSSLGLLDEYYKFLAEKKDEWITSGIKLDQNLDINHAGNINLDFYNNSFISIITETQPEPGTLFLTEKIFKPIYSGNPFIIAGSQHSLRTLREMGYKTFGKWWDESYDDIEDTYVRTLKVYELISSLAKLSKQSLLLMYQDMEFTLRHNIEVFFSSNRYERTINKIYDIQELSEVKESKVLI